MNDSTLGSAYLNVLRDCTVPALAHTLSVGDKAGMAAAPVQPRTLNVSEEDRSAEQEVWEKVCGIRRALLKHVRFDLVRGLPDIRCRMCIMQMDISRRPSSRADLTNGRTRARCEHSSLVPMLSITPSRNSRSQLSSGLERWITFFRFLVPHKCNTTMSMCFDGRSKACRRQLDDLGLRELSRLEQAGGIMGDLRRLDRGCRPTGT